MPVIQKLVVVKYLCKCFQIMLTLRQDLLHTIAVVITLKSLHENFDTTIVSLLKMADKIID